ncbi:hypothetical protein FRC02_003244 [Tulasnella sp. 418]|nr:hypothetical protein FRC02_003244 [Tulasnella sp. 418]
MRALLLLQGLVSILGLALAAPAAVSIPPGPVHIRPLVIWHGLGDTAQSPGILKFMDEIKVVHPGIFIHSIYLNEIAEQDRRAGWFGELDKQLAYVSEELRNVPELANGFDGIGFSQGGQFLRAFVEQYNKPAMHNLITFGAPHMGISDIPPCGTFDLLCRIAKQGLQRGVYSDWAQSNLVQAQYYRDPNRFDDYIEHNHWLPLINNELSYRNRTYPRNFSSLKNLVLILFSEDETLIPKESAWFGSYAPSDSPDEPKVLIPMKEQPLYVRDWIGLRKLDEQGAVALVTCEGAHMQIDRECWEPLVTQYTGGKMDLPSPDSASVLLVQDS